MGLDVVDVGRCELRVGQRGTNHRFLRRPVRHRQTATSSVLIDGAATNHRQHAIAVGPGMVEPLEYEEAAALGAGKPVGGRSEGLAPAVWR